MSEKSWSGIWAFVFGMILLGPPLLSAAPLNERVLVVYNANAEDSLGVARYYMARRKIPETNRCKVAFSKIDAINLEEYESKVKPAIRRCIEKSGKEKILYIVLSYRSPFVLMFGERGFALDQFLSDLWDEHAPMRAGNESPPHPYFANAQSQGRRYPLLMTLAEYRAQPGAFKIYSVWRLDSATSALAKGLVDKAIFAETYGLSGKGCFDRATPRPIGEISDTQMGAGEWDIFRSAEFAQKAGFPIVEDEDKAEFGTAPAPLRCDGAALYAGWYSWNHYNDAFTWTPGSIGIHLDSASAADPRGGTNWSANAVLKGITITSGAVAEPFLEGLPQPDQVFLDLFRGGVAGDALLRSTRWLKWMILNIGDPLYRPFPSGAPGFGEASQPRSN